MRSKPPSCVNVGAVERARVHPGRHAVELLSHIRPGGETTGVRASERVAGATGRAVESILGDVNVETPLEGVGELFLEEEHLRGAAVKLGLGGEADVVGEEVTKLHQEVRVRPVRRCVRLQHIRLWVSRLVVQACRHCPRARKASKRPRQTSAVSVSRRQETEELPTCCSSLRVS